jgi:plasmid stability protein
MGRNRCYLCYQRYHCDQELIMGAITVRNIDEDLKLALRKQAAAHDRSMEDEVRVLIRESVGMPPRRTGRDLLTDIRALVGKHGAADDLVLPEDEIAEPITFE